MRRTHWTCFFIQDNKPFYCDPFGSRLDKFLLKKLTKLITFYIHEIQKINKRFFGVYCSHFLYLLERLDYYNAALNFCFG